MFHESQGQFPLLLYQIARSSVNAVSQRLPCPNDRISPENISAGSAMRADTCNPMKKVCNLRLTASRAWGNNLSLCALMERKALKIQGFLPRYHLSRADEGWVGKSSTYFRHVAQG